MAGERNSKKSVLKEVDLRKPSELAGFERNPLLYPPHFESEEAMASFRFVIERMIAGLGGAPVEIETVLVQDYYDVREYHPRLVAKFKPNHVSAVQLDQLQEISARMYSTKVRSMNNRNGSMAASILYPKFETNGNSVDPSTIGWYFGPESGRPRRLHTGLFAFRSISRKDVASGVKARHDSDWFTQKTLQDNSGKKVASDYIVEIREGKMFQIDLAEAIILTSLVLAGKELPPTNPGLLYEIYHLMNLVGLREGVQIGGLEKQAAEIQEALFAPLANADLARGLRVFPRTVTLIGQKGTGKTQLIRHLMHQDCGVVMVNVDSIEFEADLMLPEHKRRILPRLPYIATRTGRTVVLIIEDIERLVADDNPASKILLNELAGLFKSNYLVICTTNHPEEFNPQLLEPERLGGRIIFCPLPNVEVRRTVLATHSPLLSANKGIPLYDSEALSKEAGVEFGTPEQAREFILNALAQATAGFTPRFLQDICNRAGAALIRRVAGGLGRNVNLTEGDLVGQSFTLGDWREAFEAVSEVYDLRQRIEEDERLKKFAQPGSGGPKPLGFNQIDGNQRPPNLFDR